MLKPKFGQCVDCPNDSPARYLTAGRCQTHYWQYRHKVRTNASKQKKDPDAAERTAALTLWFEYHNENNDWICENCQTRLIPASPVIMSSCQAHILPKELFRSVQGVLDNHMTLGGRNQQCNCHSDFDNSWQKAMSMPVFTLATERFIKFKHLILPQEIRHLPAVFYDLI